MGWFKSMLTKAAVKFLNVQPAMQGSITIQEAYTYETNLIRNKLLLVKCFCNIDIQNELFKRYKDMPDERIILFLEWICKANITSVLDIVEDLPQSIKEKYPDYPITNEYLSL